MTLIPYKLSVHYKLILVFILYQHCQKICGVDFKMLTFLRFKVRKCGLPPDSPRLVLFARLPPQTFKKPKIYRVWSTKINMVQYLDDDFSKKLNQVCSFHLCI